MDKLRAVFVAWSIIAGLGTLLAWTRLATDVRRDAGARLSFAVGLAYAGCTGFSALGTFLMPPIPEWWVWTVAPIGAMILILGQSLGVWAKGALGTAFSAGSAPADGSTLVTAGPYGICRHPIMLGFLMTWVGTAVMLGSPLMLIAFGFISIAVMRRIALEEERLDAVFGEEYARYRTKVPLITPCVDPGSDESREIEKAVEILRGR